MWRLCQTITLSKRKDLHVPYMAHMYISRQCQEVIKGKYSGTFKLNDKVLGKLWTLWGDLTLYSVLTSIPCGISHIVNHSMRWSHLILSSNFYPMWYFTYCEPFNLLEAFWDTGSGNSQLPFHGLSRTSNKVAMFYSHVVCIVSVQC